MILLHKICQNFVYVSPPDVGLGLIQLELRYFQRGMFYPGLSLSSLLARAEKIAFITISHSSSRRDSGSYNWLFSLVLRRQREPIEQSRENGSKQRLFLSACLS